MKRCFKRTLLIFATVIFLISSIFAFSSCAAVNLKMRVLEGIEFRVGEQIDVYTFVEEEKGVDYQFTISYINEEGNKTNEEKISGRAYCPLKSSRYTLTVTASRGLSKQTDSVEFDVYHVAPFLAVPSVSLLFMYNQTVPFRALLDRSSYIIVSNTSFNIWVDEVSYQESISPSIDNSVNTNPAVVTKFEKDLEAETRFTFDTAGDYTFTLIAENEGGSATAKLFAKVATPVTNEEVLTVTDGKIKALKNAEFGKDDQGNFNNTVRLLGGGNINNVSYVAMSKPYTIGQVIRLEFNGSQVPEHIGFLGAPDEGQVDPYSMTQGKGYVYGFSKNATYPWCLYGRTRRSPETKLQKRCTWGKEAEQAASRFGLNDFDVEKRYGLEMCFVGVGDMYTDATTGELRYPDIGFYWYIYEINESGSAEPYTVVSVQLPGCEAGNISKTTPYYQEGQLVFYGSTSQDITFKIYEDSLLDFDVTKQPDIEYDETTKRISWEPIEGAENYVVRVNGEVIRLYGKDKTSFGLAPYFTDDEYQVINVSVSPSIGYNDYVQKGLRYTLTISPEGKEHLALYKGTLDDETNTVTLTGGGVKSNKSTDVAAFDNSYLAFKGEFGLNTRVDFYFKGNNMPQVCLFADTLSGDMTNKSGGKGLLLMNGFCLEDGNFVPQYTQGYDANGWFILAGMDKLDSKGSTCYGGSRDSIISGFEANSLNADKNYKYSVFTAGYEDGRWFVVLYLWEIAEDGTETLVASSYDSKHLKTLPTYEVIVCYAGVKGNGNDTTFTYVEPYKCDNSGNFIAPLTPGTDGSGDDFFNDIYPEKNQ